MKNFWAYIYSQSLRSLTLLVIILGSLVSNISAQTESHLFYKEITILSSQITGSHTDFPVLISISDAELATNARSDGFDIIFTNSDGSVILDHELESYVSGALISWVKVPTISNASNTTIRMYYGNSSITTDQSNSSTWSNQFRAVYHLGSSFNDATPNGNDGTNSGSTLTSGKIGDSRSFNGDADYIALNDSYSSTTETDITVSAWVNTSSGDNQVIASFDRNEYWRLEVNGNGGGTGEIGWDLLTNSGQIDFGSNSRIDNGTWRHVVGVYNNGRVDIYLDGVLDATTTSGTAFGTGNTRFGFIGVGSEASGFDGNQGPSNNFNGDIDEFRIVNGSRSSDWIQTEFNNQNTPASFISLGGQVSTDTTPADAPTNVLATALQGASIQITFNDVDETGSGVSTYNIKRSTTSGSGYSTVGTVTDNESSSYTLTDNTAVDGTQYFYVVSAIDAANNESVNSTESTATADGTAPSLVSAEVNGSTLDINFNEPLSGFGNSVDYQVLVDGSPNPVSTVILNGNAVRLILSTEVGDGESVSVSYTAAGNPIRDLAGNVAANISNVVVTNNTQSTLPTPPIVLETAAIQGGAIAITFEDVDSEVAIASYNIKRSTTAGGPYTNITIVSDTESSGYSFTDTNTSNGVTYYYVVSSVNVNAIESSNSEELVATADDQIPGLQVSTTNGGSISIDFNELLNENSIGNTSDFTVRVNGVNQSILGIDVSGPRVILTLVNPVQAGDNIEVDYATGINPIEDIAGNDALSFSNFSSSNYTFNSASFGPDPCPIVNGQDVAWGCFSGTFNGTSMTANIGGQDIAMVTAVPGANTTFAPNALQEWASGSFSGDQFNGPQVNPSGTSGDATSLDITFDSDISTDGVVLSLNRLQPNSGATSYTLEAFDQSNALIQIDDWLTGEGTDGGVCTNSVNPVYTNGNTRIEFQPTVDSNPSCASSSTPIWFRITDANVSRIELRKVSTNPDNIHIGLGIVADFGDAPSTYGTLYSGSGTPPAFHLLNSDGNNSVFFGSGVDGDGNGVNSALANGDDLESSNLGSGDDEDAISILAEINTAQTSYQTTLVCTDGGNVGGWIDFDQSGSFDIDEYASGICASGSVNLAWTNISGLVTGLTFARFRIASNAGEVASATGFAVDGEVEDYSLPIIPPPLPDLALTKTVDNSSPVVGDTVAFTLTVTNPGVYNATGIRVTDNLPVGLTFVSASATQGTFNGGLWNVGNINDGDTTSVSLTLLAKVNNGTLGQTIINSASITGLNETDPQLGNNSASAGITIVPESANIGLTMMVDDSNPIEGQNITYTITATNNGPKTATGLTVIDQIPSGLTFVSSTESIGTYNSTSGIWDIGVLGSGSSATLTLTTFVDVGTEGNNIRNAADVNSTNQNDLVPENNTAFVDVIVVPAGFPANCSEIPTLDFSTFTLLSGTAGQVGAVYEYANVAPGIDARIEIVTNFNATLANIDQSASGTAPNFQPQIGAVNANLDEAYIDFEIEFFESATQNPRFLTFATTAVDVDGDNNSTREFVGFQRLTSFIVESATNLAIGNSGIYTTFESDLNQVNGIVLTNTDNIAYTTYTNEPRFRIRAGVKDPSNTTARLFSFNFDPCLRDNFNTPVTTNIVEVGITKAINVNNADVGDQITYTITASNNQGNAVSNVEVTDLLPGTLQLDNATPSVGTSYDPVSGVWDIGLLNGFQTVSLVINATINAGTEGTTITNTASLTNFTGTDGNLNNNTSAVNVFVTDPQSSSCNELPLFSFINPVLEQGVPNQVNAIYRFPNIASGLDALVKVVSINNATLDNIDDDGIANSPANFSPLFTSLNGGGYIDWEISLVQAGTNTPVKRDFALTGLDIDGFTTGGGGTVRDYLGFAQNQGYIVQSGNLLDESSGVFQIFESNVAQDANGTFDINHIAYILFNYTSVFGLRTGGFNSANYSDDRLVDIDFTQCRNLDFPNPDPQFRNADVSVLKTVDEANPLENSTVNFTITVTNNGPEPVTELDINESLPDGLTLVQSTPSQGTFNQLNDIWQVGSLSASASATLQLEATVNAGITQDSLINRAFIQGLNQVDPNSANDTSQVVLKIGVELTGTVFEDITGDGVSEDLTFNDAAGDQQALENVEVHLFKDGGDGIADGSDDEFLQTKLTNNLGEYTFQVGEDADYWVVVDSKTGEISDGTFWAEQTYAPIGGLCTDNSGVTQILTAAGNCFGGRRGNQSDNISSTPVAGDLINAEHIAAVTIAGSGVDDLDFGFSFNVVTNLDDTDEDLTEIRSAQGTLNQFVLNANAINGANSMRFVPVVQPNSSTWWTISLNDVLPEIADALTTIDGTAYNLNAPKSVLNTNSGTIGTGGAVGIDNLPVSTVARPEFEIDLNDVGNDGFIINSSGAVSIRNIAVFNNSTLIEVKGTSNGLIENSIIGSRADGADPAGAERGSIGILISGNSSSSVLIQQNIVSNLSGSGVKSENESSNITIFNNEFTLTGLSETTADGIEGVGSWTIEQNRIHSNGNGSSSSNNGGAGIQIGDDTGSSSGNSIRNNSIYDNATSGILTLNAVSNSIIEENLVYQNGTNFITGVKLGAGIRLATPAGTAQDGIRITRNSFYANYGISIDIVETGLTEADGVNPNDGATQSSSSVPNIGLDYPVFTLSTLEGNILTVEGYVGTSSTRLEEVFTIEIYKAEDDGDSNELIEQGGALSVPHGEGRYFLGVITTNSDGTFTASFDVSGAASQVAFNDRITAIAINSSNSTSEFSGNQRVVPTGVTISGFVFNDENHNASKDPTESGIPGVTIVLYNTQENNCKSVLSGSDGSYQFTNVLNGDYDLIESFGQSVPTPDVCTPAEVDPIDFISTTPNLRSVTVNNLPAFQDFGDFEGSKITGTIFNDNGIIGGIANDGLRNGGELVISAQTVKALSTSDALLVETVSQGDGTYDLFIPKSVIQTNPTIKVQETNGIQFISTGGSAGTTNGAYDRNTDETEFSIIPGIEYTGVDFADVQTTTLVTDGNLVTQPGTVSLFTHSFFARTSGDVVFSTSSVNNPNITFPVILNRDLDCSGTIESGEPILEETNSISVVVGDQICLVVRVVAPNGTSNGATSNTTVTATFDYANSDIEQVLTRTDLLLVSLLDGGLVIIKGVDKTQALPGDTLTYSIDYENLGDEPISQVIVTDEVPIFTTFFSALCGSLPSGITNCVIEDPGVGTRGTVRWTFTGVLQPGDSGTVSYKVLIDD